MLQSVLHPVPPAAGDGPREPVFIPAPEPVERPAHRGEPVGAENGAGGE